MSTQARAGGGADIAKWDVEDPVFWESTGKRVAYRNLALSVPALLCGFAVWGMWGIITVQMMNLGFPFSQAELFTLTAIAGISGATMRIPASFLIRLAGGRNTIFLTTAMLLAPALGTGIVLQHKDWPLWAFQLMALWCGVGGGNFASSMSNISMKAEERTPVRSTSAPNMIGRMKPPMPPARPTTPETTPMLRG